MQWGKNVPVCPLLHYRTLDLDYVNTEMQICHPEIFTNRAKENSSVYCRFETQKLRVLLMVTQEVAFVEQKEKGCSGKSQYTAQLCSGFLSLSAP